MSISIGIDLGTTNSVLAYTNVMPNGNIVSKVLDINRPVDMYSGMGGKQKLSSKKDPTIPSCIYYVEERGYSPIVGNFAKMQYPVRPHLVAKSIKSQMGKPLAEGLAPDIPDKTPAQISAQILKHMLKDASKSLRADLRDAIITVPANFDSSMCKATKDAAELAGIRVKNADGSERPILLPEPNAVIYDLFNCIRNGEIPTTVLDFSSKKRILVFDLGGGTLDITMHEIRKRNPDSNDGTLKVDEIAISRYTLLGGDDFDEVIAEAMFERYKKQYSSYPDIVRLIEMKKNEIMPQLRTHAEDLKISLNESVLAASNKSDEPDDSSDGWGSWDDDIDEEDFPVGGNIYSTGYSYDDSFTREEIEEILSVFMGDELVFDDYKRIESIRNTRNMIFPILDVLKKADDNLKEGKVVVDAVIVNGGMSKFYMVIDRLKKFFGFDPIVVLDPDQSVARGAAVYHYLLTHSNEDLSDDMSDKKIISSPEMKKEERTGGLVAAATPAHIGIEWGKIILNDSLYLGLSKGVKEEIVPTGAKLPFDSEEKKNFQIPTNQQSIPFPISSRNIDGTYRVIARGIISFNRNYRPGTKVSLQVHMDTDKIITMKAKIYDEDDDVVETASVKIEIDNTFVKDKKGLGKIAAPIGSELNPHAEIDALIKDCQNYSKKSPTTKQAREIAEKIRISVSGICQAANRREFSEIILKNLYSCNCQEARMRLFIIARKIMPDWTEREQREVAKLCITQLNGVFNGIPAQGATKNVNIQAIYTLAFCATSEQAEKLRKLHGNSDYYHPCLYAHAKTQTCIDWLADSFYKEEQAFNKNHADYIQQTAHAIGLALNGNPCPGIGNKEIEKIVKKLTALISSARLNLSQVICCILAVGWICDDRNRGYFSISDKVVDSALDALESVHDIYESSTAQKSDKAKSIACKLINGIRLSEDEEKFLLEKIESF